MNPEQWQKLDGLFHEALAREPAERAEFITQSCAGDDELRRELELMLAHDEQAAGFIESPAYVVDAEAIINDDFLESLSGKTFGAYEILRALEKGGMGAVYLAFDHSLHRQVAIKFLHDDLVGDVNRVQRFRQEARAASALNHPNILTVFDMGEVEKRHYIVTELVEGQTLRNHMLRKRSNVREVLEVGTQIASALSAAHKAGIVHRDIKPENVMLRDDGFIKVLDFGLAKLTNSPPATGPESSTQVNTGPGVIIGTVQYMSPEQLRALPVDARTDIWSLGVVLFEMLAGEPPFKDPSQSDQIAAILQTNPSFAWRTNDLPPELEWILKKALAKDQEERYQLIKELLIDLTRLRREIDAEALWQSTPRRAITDIDSQPSLSSSLETLAAAGPSKVETTVSDPTRPVLSGRKRYRKTINSLAVMPLINVSGDPDSEYLSDGITESIIDNLSQLPRLRVMARSTVFRYKGRDVDPQQVGNDLGVHAVLTGRILQRDKSLIIRAELVRVADGAQLWGQHFSREMGDILSVQEEIARQISEKLHAQASGDEHRRPAKRPTQSAEAYQLYLKGRYFWNKRTPEGFQKAIKSFEQATKVDPNYALAYSGLADCSTLLNYYNVIPPQVAMIHAKSAAEKALTADEALAEVHVSAAMVAFWYDWDWLRARIEFERAIKLNPNYPSAHEFYSWYSVAMGDFQQSIEEGEKAIDLDPLAPAINLALGKSYFFSRRYDDSIKLCRRALELDSDFVPARYFLGQSYLQQGRFDEALAEYERGLNVLGESAFGTAVFAHAQALAGNKSAPAAALDKLLAARNSNETYVPAFGIAMIYTGLGTKDEAIAWLEKACAERSLWMVYLNVDPIFDSLRGERRFQQLLDQLKFPRAGGGSAGTFQ